MLWKEICANVLLANCNIIVFFNKVCMTEVILAHHILLWVQMDILRRTLASGVEVQKYVPSYGDAPNDAASVAKCE